MPLLKGPRGRCPLERFGSSLGRCTNCDPGAVADSMHMCVHRNGIDFKGELQRYRQPAYHRQDTQLDLATGHDAYSVKRETVCNQCQRIAATTNKMKPATAMNAWTYMNAFGIS